MTGLHERDERMNGSKMAVRFVAAASIAMAFCGTGFAQNAAPGCVKQDKTYVCNWQGFRADLKAANTVAVRSEQLDPYTGVQLKDLAKSLDKKIVEKDADLGFEVVPVDTNGVRIGAGDQALAELRVYAKAPLTNRYDPIWVETYTGQMDRPWTNTVHAVIAHFQERVNKP